MPWVAACISLLAEPLLSYCLTVRDFALQAGILHPQVSQSLISSVMDAQEASQDKSVRSPVVSGVSKPPRKFAGVVIVTTGLPATGKSQVAHCLRRRLNWNGESAKVMRVSDYRRKRQEPYISNGIFRPDHEASSALLDLAQQDAMQDCASWLAAGNTIAILDAALVTRKQRAEVYEYFSGQLHYRVLFVECVCEDEALIEANCREILRYSQDYKNVQVAVGLEELRLKIAYYRQLHQPMDEPYYPRIRLDTASMEMSAIKLSGHIETTVLGYLGGLSLKPHTLYFSRHGESEFNVLGKIGGDAVLSARGERYAQALASKINSMHIPDLRVLTSRLRRTIATARGIEASQEHVAALNELYAGVCEGLSYEEMQEKYPQEFAWRDQDKLRYRYPWGESYVDTMKRVEPVLVELQQSSNVLVISHQAILRCIIGYFCDKLPEELPYEEVPLHTIIRLSSQGFGYKLEFIKMGIECVNTMRQKPQNCSATRTAADALITVPAHYDIPDPWRNPGSGPTLVQQH
ncbi:6-phosphofructo-2-kinase/fructose-2,6-bisphosphatase-like isoform X1 [Trichogramma pretiosum]|uniref:6-phosphofructo-2-kinase/fructose-2, 6-bisphosphatase-like isoform X1 n=1 Tax=Trichogramma pretiosum TaxID=7493 RepID=UPI0006C971CD|nr:6-phosphofructo-2-kinase/fructose-2,6-bisphosphatase-like isoform X1 [Trichogramma pretiosum]